MKYQKFNLQCILFINYIKNNVFWTCYRISSFLCIVLVGYHIINDDYDDGIWNELKTNNKNFGK